MTTERLQEFAVLASMLNYSNAAHLLYITQSTLSRHIAEMEQELGFQLFKRTTRNVELTEAGRLFSLSIGKLLQKYDAAMARLQIQGATATGTLSIVYTHSVSFPPFLDFCKMFRSKYPGIAISTENVTTPGIENMEGHDLYFTPANYAELPKNIKQIRVFPQSAYLFLPPGHPMLWDRSFDLSRLRGSTLFVPFNDEAWDGPFNRNYQTLLRQTGGDINFEIVPTPTAALVNVSLGKGISILPENQVTEEYQNNPSLVLHEPGFHFDINVYYDSDALTPTTALFLSELLPLQLPETSGLPE